MMPSPPPFQNADEDARILEAEVKELHQDLGKIQNALKTIILGQNSVIDLALIALLSGGHAVLVGAPGLAKTLLVESLGQVMGLQAKRIQFTPDLMPSDILGSEVLEESPEGKRSFRFIPGPVFCQLLMADEINRASPRTQSALLQAMQESHVTISGERRDLPHPFHVLATQNPLEHEGTYPLPEAQLDRFLFQIDVPYPQHEDERAMLIATTGEALAPPPQLLEAEHLMKAQALVRRLPVGESVLKAIVHVTREARPETSSWSRARESISFGPGPRAGQALMLGVRARALLQGRLAPSVDDVKALAPAALKHRMSLNFSARAEGVTVENLISDLLTMLE